MRSLLAQLLQPVGSAFTTHYAVLNLPRSATLADVKTAYRKSALKWHPDKNDDSKESHEKYAQVSAAYEVLADAKLRKQYDSKLSRQDLQQNLQEPGP